MKKRALMLLLAFLMIFTSLQPVFAISSDNHKIQWLIDKNYVDGREGEGLELDKTITRAEFTKMIVAIQGKMDEAKGLINEPSKFSDLRPDHWAKGYINLAVEKGYIKGYEDGTFKPENQISYEEIIAILSRLHPKFKDSNNIGKDWAKDYIEFAKKYEILEGINLEGRYKDAAIRQVAFELVYNSYHSPLEIKESNNDKNNSKDNNNSGWFWDSIIYPPYEPPIDEDEDEDPSEPPIDPENPKIEISIDHIGSKYFKDGDTVVIPLTVRDRYGDVIQSDIQVIGLPQGLSFENQAIRGTLDSIVWEDGQSEQVFNVIVTATYGETIAREEFTLTVMRTSEENSDLERIPEELRSFVKAYLPFENDYKDVSGNLETRYYDKATDTIYSTEEVSSSNAVFEEGYKGGSALRLKDGTYYQPMASNVLVGDQGDIDFDKNFTVSILAKEAFSAPYEEYQVLFGNRDWQNCDDGNGLLLSFLKGNKVVLDTKAGELGRQSYPRPVLSEDSQVANDWHLFTVVGDRDKGKFYTYVDGTLLIEQNYPDSVGQTMMSNQPLRIGTDGEGNFGYYGLIDDTIVFDKALNQNEVYKLASAYNFEVKSIELKTYTTRTKLENGNTKVSIELINNGPVDKENVEVVLEKLGDGQIVGSNEKTVAMIKAGESASVDFEVAVNSGSVKLFANITDDLGTTRKRASFVTSGKAGWISGDTHDHSTFSDGANSITENFQSANQQGVDYVNISDHSNSKGWDEAQIAGEKFGLIPMRGNEYSGDQYTHAVFMNVNQEKNYSPLIPAEGVKALKEDTNGQGLAYAAHPYDGRNADGSYDTSTGWDSWENKDSWDAPLDGVEVWNAWYAGNHKVNKEAKVKWDELNRQGRHLYGISNTDTHSAEFMGEAYTTVLVDEYSVDGIINAYKKGHMYGSNGPMISLNIGDNMMGDDIEVSSEGQDVDVHMTAEYIDPLNKVVLIKNGQVVWEENINAKTLDTTQTINVKPGDFIRIEVEGMEDGVRTQTGATFETSAPFALSNPIFFTGDKIDQPEEMPKADVLDVNLNERPDGTDKNGRELNIFGEPEFVKNEDGRTTVKFDGIDDGLRYTTNSEVYSKMNQDGFAVELYYRPLSLEDGKDPFGNTEGSGIGFENSNENLEFWAHLGGDYKLVGAPIENKKWVHIVATYDKESLNFYVNGELKDSKEVSGNLAEPPHYIFLGGDTNGSGNLQAPDNCEYSIARVYSQGLNQDQIKDLYDSIEKIEDKDDEEEIEEIIVEGDSSQPLRFGVISDIHVGPTRPRQSERTQKALEFFAENDANTTFIVGDITDEGKESEYQELKKVFDQSNTKDMTVHSSMGNHEGGSRELYRKYIEPSENAHYKINGYHFIKVSPDGSQWGGSYTQISKWLSKQLEIAKEDTGDKPIFVFFHHPIQDTFYVSEEWYGGMQKDVFKNYPMAVTFSGHIHSPNNHPRSIWQGDFTAVNTVSLFYFEMESGYGTGSYPQENDKCSQGMLIDVDGSKVKIRNYDFISETWIDQTWEFDTSKPEEFPYTDARYEKALAPEFEEDAKAEVIPEKRSAKVILDQAKVPAEDTLNDIVHSYEFEVYKSDDETRLEPAAAHKAWSNFHLIPMPETIETEIKGLEPGVDYTLLITPVDAFNKKGKPLEVSFKTKGTLGEQIPVEKIFDVDLDQREDGSEEFSREKTVFGQPEFKKSESGKAYVAFNGQDNGLRYTMNDEDYSKMDTDGFTIEMYYNPLDINSHGDPLGNTQNSGFCFENLSSGDEIEFWAHIGGSYKKVKFPVKSNEWSHVVATFDRQQIKVYVNGKLENSLEASGTFKAPPKYLFLGGDTNGEGDLEYANKCEFSMVRIYTGAMDENQVKTSFDNLNKF